MNILIVSPGDYATGGVELLHQLCAELDKYTNTRMWYWDCLTDSPQPKEYEVYKSRWTTVIPKGFDGLVIFPEIWANHITDEAYSGCRVGVFWESVDNYFSHTKPSDYFKFLQRRDAIHITQSQYAQLFLKGMGIKGRYVGDYISPEFTGREGKRNHTVLYNPLKGAEFTRKLMEYVSATFIPIQNMTRGEVIDAMRHAPLYIDFGDHPGKERLPREAALCGCCVITGVDGSAANRCDVDIPDMYKYMRNLAYIPHIRNMILSVLNDYEGHAKDFDAYRAKIKAEQSDFKKNVESLWQSI